LGAGAQRAPASLATGGLLMALFSANELHFGNESRSTNTNTRFKATSSQTRPSPFPAFPSSFALPSCCPLNVFCSIKASQDVLRDSMLNGGSSS
jgi:hypothetical protein